MHDSSHAVVMLQQFAHHGDAAHIRNLEIGRQMRLCAVHHNMPRLWTDTRSRPTIAIGQAKGGGIISCWRRRRDLIDDVSVHCRVNLENFWGLDSTSFPLIVTREQALIHIIVDTAINWRDHNVNHKLSTTPDRVLDRAFTS